MAPYLDWFGIFLLMLLALNFHSLFCCTRPVSILSQEDIAEVTAASSQVNCHNCCAVVLPNPSPQRGVPSSSSESLRLPRISRISTPSFLLSGDTSPTCSCYLFRVLTHHIQRTCSYHDPPKFASIHVFDFLLMPF